jgi:chemotaxis protein CheZ
LHEALTELGLTKGLEQVAQEIPGAKDRLTHIGQMTEAAATKVLNLIDHSHPHCDSFQAEGESLVHTVSLIRKSPQRYVNEFDDILGICQGFGVRATQFADEQRTTLRDIMLAQDFQDLSGQVIQKVVQIISTTEQQLLTLLMHSAPENLTKASSSGELEGPRSTGKGLAQNDVDDLLASLGF